MNNKQPMRDGPCTGFIVVVGSHGSGAAEPPFSPAAQGPLRAGADINSSYLQQAVIAFFSV